MPDYRLYKRWNPETPADIRFAGLYVPRMSYVDPCPPVIEAHLTDVVNITPIHTFPTFHRFQMLDTTATRARWSPPAKIDRGSIAAAEFLPFWDSSPETEPGLTYIGGMAVDDLLGGQWSGQFALWPQDGSDDEENRPWRLSWSWRIFFRANLDQYLEYRFFPINDSRPSNP